MEIYEKIEQIEASMRILNNVAAETGYTDAISRELDRLYDKQMQLEMEGWGVAYGKSEDAAIYVRDEFECGWFVTTKVNGKWDLVDFNHIEEAMKAFASFAREHKINTVFVKPQYLDSNNLKDIDQKADDYADHEAYWTACEIYNHYGDESALRRYYRSHDIEYDG